MKMEDGYASTSRSLRAWLSRVIQNVHRLDVLGCAWMSERLPEVVKREGEARGKDRRMRNY